MSKARKEILEAAIQLEKDGRKFYLEYAEKASNELVKKIYASLAEDEDRHIEWLKELAPEKPGLGDANRNIYRNLKDIFADAPQELRARAADAKNDIDGLRLGIEMEQRSEDAYRKWAGETDDSEAIALCNLIAEAERFHRQLIENAIEFLEETIDWFMQEEQWSFDGG
ncbi:MAG: hypothetical protein E3J72_05060 [Planctomycetota bacterium]|nr:MAG: hypothetical protein E3J72_05060 [Planctomycetota bacterium]